MRGHSATNAHSASTVLVLLPFVHILHYLSDIELLELTLSDFELLCPTSLSPTSL